MIFLAIYALMGLIFGGYYALWQNDLISRGFGVSEIASIIAAQTLISIVIDIPAGALADRIGHKRTTLLGFGIYGLAFLVPTLGGSATAVTIGVLLIGAGGAVVQGALEAWVTSVRESKDQGIKSVPFMERDQAQRAGMILGALGIPSSVALLGGTLALPWSLFFIFSLILLFLATSAKGDLRDHVTSASKAASLFQPTAWMRMFASRRQTLIFAGVLMFGMADGVVSVVLWPSLRDRGVNSPVAFGLIQTSLSVSRLIGLQFWKRTRWTEHPTLPGAAVTLSGGLFVAFAFLQGPWTALTVWLLRVAVLSVYFSAVQVLILKATAASRSRATALSIAGVLGSIGTALSTSLIGALGGMMPLTVTVVLGGAITVGAGLVFLRAVSSGR